MRARRVAPAATYPPHHTCTPLRTLTSHPRHTIAPPCRPVTLEGLPPLPIQPNAQVRIDCGYRTLNTTASTNGTLLLPPGALLWLERCDFDNFNRELYPPEVENRYAPHEWYGALVGDYGKLRMVNSTLRWYAHVRSRFLYVCGSAVAQCAVY